MTRHLRRYTIARHHIDTLLPWKFSFFLLLLKSNSTYWACFKWIVNFHIYVLDFKSRKAGGKDLSTAYNYSKPILSIDFHPRMPKRIWLHFLIYNNHRMNQHVEKVLLSDKGDKCMLVSSSDSVNPFCSIKKWRHLHKLALRGVASVTTFVPCKREEQLFSHCYDDDMKQDFKTCTSALQMKRPLRSRPKVTFSLPFCIFFFIIHVRVISHRSLLYSVRTSGQDKTSFSV